MSMLKCRKCGGTHEIKCEVCNGTGKKPDAEGCWKCNNTGKVECDHCHGTGDNYIQCPTCRGDGEVGSSNDGLRTCPACGGRGYRNGRECECCHSTGEVPYFGVTMHKCSRCNGTGKILDPSGDKCWWCKGTGKVDCSYCNGTGVESCHHCEGKGTQPCPDCEKRGKKSETRREFLKWDFYGVVLLLSVSVVVWMPVVLGELNFREYLTSAFRPSLVTGIVAFLLAGYIRHFFGVVFHNSYTNKLCINDRIIFELIGVLSVIAIVQGVYAKVPQVEQFLLPATDWLSGIPSTEWSYIAGVCALKVSIISLSKKWGWDWGFLIEKGLIVLLALLALVFAIWPIHLPDGMALKGVCEQALPYVALPVRFIGLAVCWTVNIILWATGFIGGIVVSLVMWVISLF